MYVSLSVLATVTDDISQLNNYTDRNVSNSVRLTVVSCEAKKKQQAHTFQDHAATTVSNLHSWQLKIFKRCSQGATKAIA